MFEKINAPKLPRILITLTAILGSTALFADENIKSFRVEVIPFTNLSYHSTNQDVEWESYKSKIEWPEELAEITKGEPQFKNQVRAATPKLTGTYNSLNRASQYGPLSLDAWYSTIPANRWGKAVHIQRGSYHADPMNANDYYLNGYIRLQRGYYLHLLVEMEYQAPGDPELYHIKERRRVNSGDIHYFDNPAFGIVTKVNILKNEESSE